MSYGSASSVSALLHQLGGIYRDPSRVDRDISTLLRSKPGVHLRPSISSLTENSGDHHAAVMVLSGTLPIQYRGAEYQIPIDIYVPPAYPVKPPIAYVRPLVERNMVIKENHPHVANDGMIFMPYLHSWRPHSHNLAQLAVSMSALFGKDPPLFTKTPARGSNTMPGSRTHESPRTSVSPVYTPPRLSSETNTPLDISELARAQREQEAKVSQEVEAANRALQVARLAEAEDFRIQNELRDSLSRKLYTYLQAFMKDQKSKISQDLSDQQRLEMAAQTVIPNQLKQLREAKGTLEREVSLVKEKTEKVQEQLDKAEASSAEEKKVEVDDLCVPSTPCMAQMLKLGAENAAITDALYFLDKALVNSTISLDLHQKTVRKLAKRQFLVRAHVIKIGQLLSHYPAPGKNMEGTQQSYRLFNI